MDKKQIKKQIFGFLILVFGLLLLRYADALANPASTFCIDQGYNAITATDSTGGQIGYCVSDNGIKCEEWEYYYKCNPPDTHTADLDTVDADIVASSCLLPCGELCAGEGEYSNPSVSPEYQTPCCTGLSSFNPNPSMTGNPQLCYNPEKGTPVCMNAGTRSEGWYYSRTNELIRYDDCSLCVDTDGGKEYYIKGYTRTLAPEIDDVDEDFCRENTLVEQYCEGDSNKQIFYDCPNGCKEGACIKEPVYDFTYSVSTDRPSYEYGDTVTIYGKLYGEDLSVVKLSTWVLTGDGQYHYVSMDLVTKVQEQGACVASGECYSGKQVATYIGKYVIGRNYISETIEPAQEVIVRSAPEDLKYLETQVVSVTNTAEAKIETREAYYGDRYKVISIASVNGDAKGARTSFYVKESSTDICRYDSDCEAVFSHCSCSWICTKSTDGPRGDCERECPAINEEKPVCICENGICMKEKKEEECKKICLYDGTRSEGWYDSCTLNLIKYDDCATNQNTECNGCFRDNVCLPFGTRLLNEGDGVYCSISKELKLQEQDGALCQNDYECQSNSCASGRCTDIAGELKETRNMLQKILDWLKNIF